VCGVASSWHFTLFHEEDARPNNPHKNRIDRTATIFNQDLLYIKKDAF